MAKSGIGLNFPLIFKWVDIVSGFGMIGFAIFLFVAIFLNIKVGKNSESYFNWYEPWKIFAPLYIILFSIILICSEFEVKVITTYFVFLENYFGLGIYIIYMATLCFNSLYEI